MLSTERSFLCADINRCIKYGRAEDFSRLLPDITANAHLFIDTFHCEITSAFISSVEFICAYASRFPESFSEKDLSYCPLILIICAAQRSMQMSYHSEVTILKKANISEMFCDDFDKLLFCAMLYDCSECVDHLLNAYTKHHHTPLVPESFLFYLYDMGYTGYLDRLLVKYQKKDIISVFNSIYPVKDDIIFEYCGKRAVTEYFYDTCVRYIPKIKASKNKADAVSAFMEKEHFSFLDLFINNLLLSDEEKCIAELSAMKRLGLRLKDITILISCLSESDFLPNIKASPDKFREYILPILGDKLTLRLFSLTDPASYSSIGDLPMGKLISLLKIIGIDRIFFDLTSETLTDEWDSIDIISDNMEKSRSRFRRLVNSGIGFMTDEDLNSGNAADTITRFPVLLEAMLDQKVFSTGQLNSLVLAAAESKRLEALNILNKFMLSGVNCNDSPDSLKGGLRYE